MMNGVGTFWSAEVLPATANSDINQGTLSGARRHAYVCQLSAFILPNTKNKHGIIINNISVQRRQGSCY